MQRESVTEVLVSELGALCDMIAARRPYEVLALQAASVIQSAARVNLVAIDAVQLIRLGRTNDHARRYARMLEKLAPPAG